MAVKRYVLLFFIFIFLISCAHTSKKTNYTDQKVKQTIKESFDAFQKKDKREFFKGVSTNYYVDYREFERQIEDFLLSHSNIQLDFNIEKILTTGKLISAEIKWFKTYSDRQGNIMKREGLSTLIFELSNGKSKLVNIKGDNPFTQ